MESPPWMSLDFFEKALADYFEKNVTVLSFTSNLAVPVGDNYTSNMYRVVIKYSCERTSKEAAISIVIKCAPHDGGVMEDFVTALDLFQTEMSVYKGVLQRFHKVLSSTGTTLSSRYIYSSKKPDLIVMEDLKPHGFQMLERHEGFGLEHCLLVMEKLAAFHAASIVVHEEDPHLVEKYNKGLFSGLKQIYEWMNSSFECLVNATEKWAGCERYAKKLKNLGHEEFTRRGLESTKRGAFNVLNHGDMWVNNMLFSLHPNGKPKDVRFVDFQLCLYSSPSVDLHYFLCTSPNVHVRAGHLNHILDYYYSQLLVNLARMRYDLEEVVTRAEFLLDFKERAFYGFLASATVLPVVKASSRKDASLEDLMKDDDSENGFRYHCYNNDRYRTYMEHLLPYFDKLGILDP